MMNENPPLSHKQCLSLKIRNKIASFKVGEVIFFYLYDQYDSEITLMGEIVEISGNRARVKHDYGECWTSLYAADHIFYE